MPVYCASTTPATAVWWLTREPPDDGGDGREVLPTKELVAVEDVVNVLDKLPKRLRPRAQRALREVMYASTKADAETAMLTFFSYPAEHWQHLRTTTLIESPLTLPQDRR